MFRLQKSEARAGEISQGAQPDRRTPDKPTANSTGAEEKLTSAVRTVYAANSGVIQKIKSDAEKKWAEPNFIWERLLGAAATLGNARGAKLVHDDKLHDPVRYPALLPLTEEKRIDVLTRSLRAAQVRMAVLKAKRLAANFKRSRTRVGQTRSSSNWRTRPAARRKLHISRPLTGSARSMPAT